MYVYMKTEPTLWTVGLFDPSGVFHPESDHNSPDLAAKRVIEMNGGTPEGSVTLMPDEILSFATDLLSSEGVTTENLPNFIDHYFFAGDELIASANRDNFEYL